MNIELPKDADGREIPLDTEVLFRNQEACVACEVGLINNQRELGSE